MRDFLSTLVLSGLPGWLKGHIYCLRPQKVKVKVKDIRSYATNSEKWRPQCRHHVLSDPKIYHSENKDEDVRNWIGKVTYLKAETNFIDQNHLCWDLMIKLHHTLSSAVVQWLGSSHYEREKQGQKTWERNKKKNRFYSRSFPAGQRVCVCVCLLHHLLLDCPPSLRLPLGELRRDKPLFVWFGYILTPPVHKSPPSNVQISWCSRSPRVSAVTLLWQFTQATYWSDRHCVCVWTCLFLFDTGYFCGQISELCLQSPDLWPYVKFLHRLAHYCICLQMSYSITGPHLVTLHCGNVEEITSKMNKL